MDRPDARAANRRQDLALLLLRLALAVVFIAHGGQKLFGWWGGRGLSSTIANWRDHYHFPAALTALAAATEFFGGIGALVGLLTRVAALGIVFVMVVGTAVSGELANGFFMNWTGRKGGEGFEFNLTLFLLSLALVVGGSGHYGLDRLIRDRLKTH